MGNPLYEAEVGYSYNLGNAPITKTDHLGTRYFPGNTLVDCVYAREISSPRQECFWSGTDFRGWQNPWDLYGDRAGAGTYWLSLVQYLYE